MVFKCRCCKQIVDEKPRFIAGLSEFAYNAEWLEAGEPVPPLEGRFWSHADALPKAGERRIIKVGFYTPFNSEIGDSFNVLFQPANSALNGWDEAPEELERSAVVSCVFEKVVSSDEYQAFIEISINRVVTLPELCGRFPCVKPESLFADGFGENLKREFTWHDWEYYSFDAQGDCGEWRLIFTDSEDVRHLILLCNWGWHGGHILFGNAASIGEKRNEG